MSFDIIEIDKTIRAKNRPVIIIYIEPRKIFRSFPRPLYPHHIAFPTRMGMRSIRGSFPELSRDLLENTVGLLSLERSGVEKSRHPGTDQLDQGAG
jgi:hypothetical protein